MIMKKQWVLASMLATALLAGCGGGDTVSSSLPVPPAPVPAPNIGNTVSVLIQYVQQLIAATDNTSEPVDINGLTLVADDMAEPTAI